MFASSNILLFKLEFSIDQSALFVPWIPPSPSVSLVEIAIDFDFNFAIALWGLGMCNEDLRSYE